MDSLIDTTQALCRKFAIATDSAHPHAVHTPITGGEIARIPLTSAAALEDMIAGAVTAQAAWATRTRAEREAFLLSLAAAIQEARADIAQLLAIEAGKTLAEAQGEVDNVATVLTRTIEEAQKAEALPRLGDVERRKEGLPVGVVGLITSFNFPFSVAGWTIAPALLAGNAVIWKPSEKTPLTALACLHVFRNACKESGVAPALLQVMIGRRDVGSVLVASESVGMVSATGSVGMGKAIEAALAKKVNRAAPPILELGGNNALIFSASLKGEDALIDRAVAALLQSAWGTAGQRCTDTRRLFVADAIYDTVLERLKRKYAEFIASGAIRNPLEEPANPYGYGPLIDRDAFERFERAKGDAAREGGRLHFGKRLLAEQYPNAYYVEPAIAEMSAQPPGGIMHEETFAPLLYVMRTRSFDEALALTNAPANAGLVNGLYTTDPAEAEQFGRRNEAGHGVINMPRGTGTPAQGMGFGGNKDSGRGEILNAADPLRPFTFGVRRIAQDTSFPLRSG